MPNSSARFPSQTRTPSTGHTLEVEWEIVSKQLTWIFIVWTELNNREDFHWLIHCRHATSWWSEHFARSDFHDEEPDSLWTEQERTSCQAESTSAPKDHYSKCIRGTNQSSGETFKPIFTGFNFFKSMVGVFVRSLNLSNQNQINNDVQCIWHSFASVIINCIFSINVYSCQQIC